jgi:hypothetical protein
MRRKKKIQLNLSYFIVLIFIILLSLVDDLMLNGIGQVTLGRGESHKIDVLETEWHVGVTPFLPSMVILKN